MGRFHTRQAFKRAVINGGEKGVVLQGRNRPTHSVMSKAIRPGMTSGGTTKLIHETTTKRPEMQESECVDSQQTSQEFGRERAGKSTLRFAE